MTKNKKHKARLSDSLYRVKFTGSKRGIIDVWAVDPQAAIALAAVRAEGRGRTSYFTSVSQVSKKEAKPINNFTRHEIAPELD